MDRFLGRLFFGMAIILVTGTVIICCDLHAVGLNPLRAKTFWAMLIFAGCLVVVGSKLPTHAKFKILLLFLTVGLVEVVLQASSWLGLLPGVNTKERIPFGRVYWTGEGLGNSIRNRYGWYYPEFDLQKSNRLAIIGDSFVEAVEVHRTRNMSAVLAEQMRERSGGPAVLGLGNHGSGPAHYLEVLQYAHRHFAISNAILVVYLGNDISDCSAQLKAVNPAQFIFYGSKPDSSLVLEPGSEQARRSYVNGLESPHRQLWLFAPRLLMSHCMSVQLPLSVRDTRSRQGVAARNHLPANPAERRLAQLGLQGAPFAINPSTEAQKAMTVLKLLLGRAAEFAAERGIHLGIVTIPFFPPEFYSQTGANWSARLGEYDFLAPERVLADWASQHHIPFLALGQQMRQQRLVPKDIRAFYLSDGSGHFSEAGHRFAAQAIAAAFFDAQHSEQ